MAKYKSEGKNYKFINGFDGEALTESDEKQGKEYRNYEIVNKWVEFNGYNISSFYIDYDEVIDELINDNIIEEY